MTAPIDDHSIGRSGGQRELSPPMMTRDDQERAAEADDDISQPARHKGAGAGVGGAHEGFAPARAAIRSRQ